jgi:hypothetical protein
MNVNDNLKSINNEICKNNFDKLIEMHNKVISDQIN